MEVKRETLEGHGAVSEEVAGEMAAGARGRFGASYGLAVTGVAGPSGGTATKPVGTVCFALAEAGATASGTALLGGDRGVIRTSAEQRALDMLRRRLLTKGASR